MSCQGFSAIWLLTEILTVVYSEAMSPIQRTLTGTGHVGVKSVEKYLRLWVRQNGHFQREQPVATVLP